MSFEWDESPEDAFVPLYDQAVANAQLAVRDLLLSYAPRIEAWLKQNAGWTDRTSNARQGLYAQVEEFANGASLIADHSMWYGWFLETQHAGRFSIISPAIDHFFPQIVEDLRRLFER